MQADSALERSERAQALATWLAERLPALQLQRSATQRPYVGRPVDAGESHNHSRAEKLRILSDHMKGAPALRLPKARELQP